MVPHDVLSASRQAGSHSLPTVGTAPVYRHIPECVSLLSMFIIMDNLNNNNLKSKWHLTRHPGQQEVGIAGLYILPNEFLILNN